MKKNTPFGLFITLLCCLLTAACGSNNGNNPSTPSVVGTGSLSFSLTDASTDQYRAVYIKIDEVQVYMGGDEEDANSWKTVVSPMKIYNLLGLVNGVVEQLGISPLAAGTYQQIRLIIGTTPTNETNIFDVVHPFANYVIGTDGRTHELKIPSGIITGIKIVKGFDINADQTTELILDFDASASVVQAGTSGNWLLKPTVKVLNAEERAIVSGVVYESVDSEPSGVEGARVSLQYETAGPEDPKDAVTVQTATVSDVKGEDTESGEYVLLVEPGSYTLVAYKDGYSPTCAAVEATTGETTVQDIRMTQSAMGTVEGNVLINGASPEQYATLSFRQSVVCGGAENTIEVRSIRIENQYWYSISLPAGTYSLVASSNGTETGVYDNIEVTNGAVVTQYVALGS